MSTLDPARFDAASFLRDYWQKKPLLIRNPWTNWRNPLEPDELAGLGCEPGIESRLISSAADALALEHGPLPPDRFDALGTAPWTLLVQAVDHHVPAVADLIQPFRFIPNWRIDDVMVSFATTGGGVGAHFDQYDVFLVQGLGRRRWQVGGMCDETTPLLPHDSLRLLADFEPVADYVLEPGDILYVPPGIAHEGTSLGNDCMTYSIGFRAPSVGELVDGWTEHLLDTSGDDDRYTDPDLTVPESPGAIAPQALDRLHTMITERLGDKLAFARWFGEFTTAPKPSEIDWTPDDPFDAERVEMELASGAEIVRNSASRFAFIEEEEDAVSLFVDGTAYHCSAEAAEVARILCNAQYLGVNATQRVSSDVVALLVILLNAGAVAIVEY